jgi:hypothetical protein
MSPWVEICRKMSPRTVSWREFGYFGEGGEFEEGLVNE